MLKHLPIPQAKFVVGNLLGFLLVEGYLHGGIIGPTRPLQEQHSHLVVVSVCVFFLGGGLLIVEMILNEDKTGPKNFLLQSLNMLIQMEGKERTAAEYKQLLEKHGFTNIQAKQLESAGIGAILCRKA